MIGIDTNLLVRYLTQDDPAQSKKASAVIEKALAGESGVFINHVVLCEVVWVLDRAYGFPRVTLGDVLEKILQGKQFEIEDKPTAWQALNDFKSSKADYADCLIGAKNRKAGCTTTLTLDRATSALSTFSPL
jgi:predicted nucleic-acid-binding protein